MFINIISTVLLFKTSVTENVVVAVSTFYMAVCITDTTPFWHFFLFGFSLDFFLNLPAPFMFNWIYRSHINTF